MESLSLGSVGYLAVYVFNTNFLMVCYLRTKTSTFINPIFIAQGFNFVNDFSTYSSLWRSVTFVFRNSTSFPYLIFATRMDLEYLSLLNLEIWWRTQTIRLKYLEEDVNVNVKIYGKHCTKLGKQCLAMMNDNSNYLVKRKGLGKWLLGRN